MSKRNTDSEMLDRLMKCINLKSFEHNEVKHSCENYIINVNGINFLRFPYSQISINMNNIESIGLRGNTPKEYVCIRLLNNKVIEIWNSEYTRTNDRTQYLSESKEYIHWVKKYFCLINK